MKIKNNAALDRRSERSTHRPKLRLAAAKLAALTAPERLDGFGARPAAERSKASQTKQRIQDAFADKFEALANDPEKFHQMMKTVYGEGYDKNAAEGLRRRALDGDTSWMPEIRFVDPSTLQGGNGAYDADGDVVYLNNQLDLDTAVQTYIEEAGHALDTKLNKTDTAGDEGELFRRLMGGEELSAAQLREIRTENDKGTIVVDGKRVEVEFWKPFKKLKEAAKKVGKAIKNAAKKVGSAVKNVAQGIGRSVRDLATGIGEGIVGLAKGIFTGKPRDGFRDLFKGLDKAFIRSSQNMVKGLFAGANDLFHAATSLLPKAIRKPVNWFGSRVISATSSLVTGALDVVRAAVWAPLGAIDDFLGGQKSAWKKLFKGDVKGFFKDFGKSFYRGGKRLLGGVFDVLARALAVSGTFVGTIIGVESKPIPIPPDLKEQLKGVYGNSLDLDLIEIKRGGLGSVGSSRVVGNTVYLEKDKFNADGTLNEDGIHTLLHELGHVWQNQNGSTAYLHEALLAQAGAHRRTGERDNAYNWEDAVEDEIPFGQLNPEEQAEIISIYTELTVENQPIVTGAVHEEGTLTQEQAEYIRDAGDLIRRGIGAP